MSDNRDWQADICGSCKRDKPWGCNTSIKDKEVVKGVGVVGCKKYDPLAVMDKEADE